jgi:hypothetical protein
VLLALLAALYVVIAREPAAHRTMVAIVIAGRAAGFAVLAWSALERSDLPGLWAPALIDLALALLHALFGRRLWR